MLADTDDYKAITLNLWGADEYVPEIEQVIKELVRTCYHCLPYKQMPLALLVAIAQDCACKTNLLTIKNGVSPCYSLRTLVEKKHLNFEHHSRHSFGTCMQALMAPKNSMRARTEDAIHMHPVYNAQGGHMV